VQLSALRVERFLAAALDLMPERCHAVLELRRSDEALESDPAGPSQDRWVSPLADRSAVAAVLSRWKFQILHDGMAGFGFYDPGSPLEVFLDDHKLVSVFAPDLEPFEGLLASMGVPHRERLETALDHEHEHRGLVAVPDRSGLSRHEWLRSRRYDVEFFGRAIRRALHMSLEPQPNGETRADTDDE